MPSVDNRVVEMRFDNKEFQSGIADSIDSINNLKTALSFKNIDKGFQAIEKAANGLSFGGIAGNIETIASRFSTLGIIGTSVLQNLASKAFDLGEKIVMAVPRQIVSGGKTRAMNIEQAKFQLDGLGVAWEKINNQIDFGVKDTAYGMDAAAKVASQLVASGVEFTEGLDPTIDGLDEMSHALRGISGVAAMTNSSYEDIGNIFTTVAGQGKLMSMQLNQIAGRGLNVAATLATFFNDVNSGALDVEDSVLQAVQAISKSTNVTEADIRELVSKGKINFRIFSSAMDYSFGEQSKKANETFTGAFSNMNAALSRIGADFAAPILTGSRDVFNALRNTFNAVRTYTKPFAEGRFTKTFGQAVDFIVSKINNINLGALEPIVNTIANTFDALFIVFKELTRIAGIAGMFWDDFFPGSLAENIEAASENLLDFANGFKVAADSREFFKGLLSILSAVTGAFTGLGDLVSPFGKYFENLGKGIVSYIESFAPGRNGEESERFIRLKNALDGVHDILAGVSEMFQKLVDIVAPAFNYVEPFIDKILDFVGSFKDEGNAVDDLLPYLSQLGLSYKEIQKMRQGERGNLGNLKAAWAGIVAVFDLVAQAASAVFHGLEPLFEKLRPFAEKVLSVAGAIGDWLVALDEGAKESDIFNRAVSGIASFITNASSVIKTQYEKIKNFFSSLYSAIAPTVESIKEKLSGFISSIKESSGIDINFSGLSGFFTWLFSLVDFEKVADTLSRVFEVIGNVVGGIIDALSDAVGKDGGLSLANILAAIFTLNFAQLGLSVGGILSTVTEITAGINGALAGMVANLDADVLWKIAKSIGLVAGALWLLSGIESEDLWSAVAAIGALTTILVTALKVVDKVTAASNAKWDPKNNIFKNITNLFSSKTASRIGLSSISTILYSLAAAILALAVSVKILASTENMWSGVGGLVVLLGALLGAMYVMQKINETSTKGTGNATKGLIKLAISMLLLLPVIKTLSSMSPDALGTGMLGFTILLAELVGAMAILGNLKNNTEILHGDPTSGLIKMAISMLLLLPIIKTFSSMNPDSLGQAMLGFTILLGELVGAMAIMGQIKGGAGNALGVIGLATAMLILIPVINTLSSMNPDALGVSLLGFTILLGEMVAALALMKRVSATHSIGIAAAILILATGMAALGVAMRVIGGMDWESWAKGIAAIAAVFVILGVAAALLTPVIGTVVALAGSFVLIGVGALAFGAGLLAAGLALNLFGASVTVLATGIVAAIAIILSGIVGLGPLIQAAISTLIVALVGAIVTSSDAIVTGFLTVLADIVTALDKFTPTLLSHFWNFILTILVWFGEMIPTVVPILVNDILILINSLIIGLIGALPEIRTAITSLITAIGATVMEVLLGTFGWLIQGFDLLFGTNFYDQIVSFLETGEEQTVTQLEEANAKLQSENEELKSTANDLNNTADEIEAAQNRINGSGGSAQLMHQQPGTTTNVGSNIADDAIASIDSSETDVNSSITELLNALASGQESVTIAGTEIGSAALSSIRSGLESGDMTIADIMGWFAEGGVQGILDHVGDIESAGEAAGQAGVDGAATGAGTASPSWKTALIGMYMDQGLANGITNNASRPINAAIALANQVVQAFNRLSDRMRQSGQYIVDGLIQGINDKTPQLLQTVENLSIMVHNTFDAATKISSPSKLFAQSGGYIVAGLVKGIDDSAYSAENAARNLGNNVLDTTNAVIGQIIAAMDEDMDFSPRIIPVVDMSNVSSSAQYMNGLFGQNPALAFGSGAFANMAGRAVYGMQSNNAQSRIDQNANVLNAIRDLRGDVNSLNDAMSKMQVVMDSGELVGAIGGKVDRKLGSIQSKKERWM